MVGIPKIRLYARWAKDGITVAGGNGLGSEVNQLYFPTGLVIDDDGTMFIADWWNNRIVAWEQKGKEGRVLAGRNGSRNKSDGLFRPSTVVIDRDTNSFLLADNGKRRVIRSSRQTGDTRKETILDNVVCWGLAIDDEGSFYVTDTEKHEVRRYRRGETMTTGTIVAGGNGQGKRDDQLDTPLYVCVDSEHAVYVSDHENHRVMKWVEGAAEGVPVAGGQSSGQDLAQLWFPSGIVVDDKGTVYVADSQNHRVLRWNKGEHKGELIAGGHGQGQRAYQFNEPKDLYFDNRGDLYVVDNRNHRVQRFAIQ